VPELSPCPLACSFLNQPVIFDVLAKDQTQVPFTCDQHPVQALAPGTAHPAFGYRVHTQ